MLRASRSSGLGGPAGAAARRSRLCLWRTLRDAVFLEQASEMTALGAADPRRDRHVALSKPDETSQVAHFKLADGLILGEPVVQGSNIKGLASRERRGSLGDSDSPPVREQELAQHQVLQLADVSR